MKKRLSLFLICMGLIVVNPIGYLGAAGLTAEQLEQQIQLSHMLGQITLEEQNYRIQKVRTLGVDGYYKWLRSEGASAKTSASNNRSR